MIVQMFLGSLVIGTVLGITWRVVENYLEKN